MPISSAPHIHLGMRVPHLIIKQPILIPILGIIVTTRWYVIVFIGGEVMAWSRDDCTTWLLRGFPQNAIFAPLRGSDNEQTSLSTVEASGIYGRDPIFPPLKMDECVNGKLHLRILRWYADSWRKLATASKNRTGPGT